MSKEWSNLVDNNYFNTLPVKMYVKWQNTTVNIIIADTNLCVSEERVENLPEEDERT